MFNLFIIIVTLLSIGVCLRGLKISNKKLKNLNIENKFNKRVFEANHS
jgi:hypothetical protein